jgi:hypothetical protein
MDIKEMVDSIASVVVDGIQNVKAFKADYCSKAGLGGGGGGRKPPQLGHQWHTCDGCQVRTGPCIRFKKRSLHSSF